MTDIGIRSTADLERPRYASSSVFAATRASLSADTYVFAKSCSSVPVGSTAAEPASNFGATALLASTGTVGTVGWVVGTPGALSAPLR